jgi:hypothetical protein
VTKKMFYSGENHSSGPQWNDSVAKKSIQLRGSRPALGNTNDPVDQGLTRRPDLTGRAGDTEGLLTRGQTT